MPPRLRAQLPRPLRLQHNPQGAFICWRCQYATAASAPNATTPAPSQSHMPEPLQTTGTSQQEKDGLALTLALSQAAFWFGRSYKSEDSLTPLPPGLLAFRTFPPVPPHHAKGALQILAPHAPDFPAP